VAAGICVAQIGEFSFVLGGVARAEGLLSDDTLNLFIGTSIVTLLLVPWMVSAGSRLAAGGRPKRSAKMVDATTTPIVVIGIGPSATRSMELVQASEHALAVIDLNDRAVIRMRQEGAVGLVGDARREEMLQAAGVERALMVIVTLPDPVATAAVVERVRVLAPETRIVARCSYNRAESLLRRAGGDDLILEEDAVGDMLAQAVESSLLPAGDS